MILVKLAWSAGCDVCVEAMEQERELINKIRAILRDFGMRVSSRRNMCEMEAYALSHATWRKAGSVVSFECFVAACT